MLHMFATSPPSGCPFSGSAGTIYEKTSPLNNISFAPGRGTPVMQDGASPNLNNVTGTKQNVTAGTGLVTLASNDVTSRYWHSDSVLGSPSPTVAFTQSTVRGAAPLDVSFKDTSTGVNTWSWSFGDGSTSTTQNPTHTFTSAGTYTVTLVAATPGGATATATSTVTVDPPVVSGAAVRPGTSTSVAQPTATTAVTLTKPAQTSVGDVLVANFTVDNKPTITDVPAGWTSLLPSTLKPGSACSVFAFYHVVDASDDARSGWTWTLSAAQKWGGGVTRYLGVDKSHPVDTTVSTAVDNTTSATSVTVPGITTLTSGAMVIGGLGADGSTVTTTPPAGFTETWDSTGGKSAEHAYLPQSISGPTGNRTWTISAGRALGAWMTALRADPTAPVVAPTASFTASVTSGSAPLQGQFTDTSTSKPTSWAWDFGDGTASTQQNPAHTYDASGSYTVSLKVTNSAGSDTATQAGLVTVQAPPSALAPVSKLLTIVEENNSLDQMTSSMPYLFGLAQRFAYADHYSAIRHPSLPNYLAIAGGDTFGVTADGEPATYPVKGHSVFGQALARGRTARTYAESMSDTCALTGNVDKGYAVKHNPWAYFVDEREACSSSTSPPVTRPTAGS